ncbi:MAG TPA: hypothetical protein VKT32_10095 [Chthonomonadaceae bacterium]|nr:hypothetical protein [Chthonomonadaceae bacterium]
METLSPDNRRRLSRPPGFSLLLTALLLAGGPGLLSAQTPPASPAPPQAAPPAAPAGAGQTPTMPPGPPPQLPQPAAPPVVPVADIRANGGIVIGPDHEITAQDVVLSYQDITLSADRAEGNLDSEIVFSGHARIEMRGAVSYADAIHYYPRTRWYRLDRPSAVLQPQFLQERVLDPVFARGGEVTGNDTGYSLAERFMATTCIETHPHYELRVKSAELIPYKRLILRHVGVVLFGQKLIVLPYVVIPLDVRRPRYVHTDYMPEFGQNVEEGYYARFPYTIVEGLAAATLLRMDFTQKLGEGYRVEQEYLAGKQASAFNTTPTGAAGLDTPNGTPAPPAGFGVVRPALPALETGIGPQNGGLFTMQGYFSEGFSRNLNASFTHQQSIGGANRFSLQTSLQRNSFYSFTDQTNLLSRFDFAHNDPAHGVTADLNLNFNSNASPSASTSQLTGSLHQAFVFDTLGANRNSLSYALDFSRYASSGTGIASQSQQLNPQVQFEHDSRDYALTLQANTSLALGSQSSQTSNIGVLERLPELQLSADTYNFKGGWLQQLPLHLDFGAGRYSEPGTDVTADRFLMGLAFQDSPILRGRVEMTEGGGFEQRFYSDGAAQYIVRDSTRMRVHLGKRSGIDFDYQYAQPEGGTPFLFDTYEHTHFLTAEAGYLDDRHFQLTAQVGRDFLGTSRLQPWQSLSTRMMWRPSPRFRLDMQALFDPNTRRFLGLTNIWRVRGANNMALDIYTGYDPHAHTFAQLNSQFDIPLGHSWRFTGLLRYNGYTKKFESRNFEITHDWDCMAASLTYTEAPLSYRPYRELYFTLRIKAFPFFRSFAHGPAGEALGPGIGTIY